MRSDVFRGLILAGALLTLAGCATSEEWNTWREHPTHFASGTHMGFSVRNRDAESPRVTRQDVAAARQEAWWGKPVTVGQEQILER